jgi:hypothetical protein
MAHRVEIIEPGVNNLEMVTAQDGLMLIVTENTALKFAGYEHGLLGCVPAPAVRRRFTPRMTSDNWLWPSRRRQLVSAASARLKIMASAVLF